MWLREVSALKVGEWNLWIVKHQCREVENLRIWWQQRWPATVGGQAFKSSVA
jgi:hypothetical protein